MRVIETKVYKINEHPNKELCFEWIRDNWHDLNQYSVNELIDSIKELSRVIGGTFDYSIGQSPNRGEHITFRDYDKELLSELVADNLPLTGVCWDGELIEGLVEGDNRVLDMLHNDTEYQYSDEGLQELCESNDYEFNEDGSLC
jgi:hypothetical protein